MASIDIVMHRGIARYHRYRAFFASNKKSAEPKSETMLNSSIIAIKKKGDVGIIDIKRSIMDAKTMNHAIKKMADARANEIFTLTISSL